MVKVILHTKRNCSYRKEFGPCGSKFFPLREVLNLGAIDEKHCLFQIPFDDKRNFFSILATPLHERLVRFAYMQTTSFKRPLWRCRSQKIVFESTSTSILCVCEQRRLCCVCAIAQARLCLSHSAMRPVSKSNVLVHMYNFWRILCI